MSGCAARAWIRASTVAKSMPADRSLIGHRLARRGPDGADAVMGLRVQKERMRAACQLAEYIDAIRSTRDALARAKPGALYLHPGPINEGVEVTREVALGPRSLVLEQARNGVPVRMAVLALVAGALGRGWTSGGRGHARPVERLMR